MVCMDSFSAEIKKCERDYSDTYDIKKGSVPIVITSAHGIEQKKRGGFLKLAEPYTRGIARYVGRKSDCYYLIKNEDTGVDPNKHNGDEFKAILCDLVNKNHIKVLIDLHGAKKERDFDVEIGTMNDKTASGTTVNALTECLKKNGINNITLNDPFKGGDIIRTVSDKTGIECIQLEINNNYRNIRKIKNLKRICKALIMFAEGLQR